MSFFPHFRSKMKGLRAIRCSTSKILVTEMESAAEETLSFFLNVSSFGRPKCSTKPSVPSSFGMMWPPESE